MTRQDQIIKWLCYALGLLPIWVLDAFLLGRWPVFGFTPMLLPLAVVSVAVLEGAKCGGVFGLGVGLLWSIGYPGSHSLPIIFLTLTGLFSGTAAQYALTQGFAGCLICSAAALAAQELVHILWGLFIQLAPLSVLLTVACKEFLITLVWAPAVFLVFRLIFNKVGLDKLA